MDVRRVGRVVLVLALAALASAAVIEFVAGAHKNSQITELRHDGVPVPFRVSGCLGQLGGSGSNAAGYSCTGTYRLDGHLWHEPIPGNTLLAPGQVLPAVAVPGDPALVTTTAILRGEQASWRVYILPTVLVILFMGAVTALLWRRARRRRPS
jgi:hypothetical protein